MVGDQSEAICAKIGKVYCTRVGTLIQRTGHDQCLEAEALVIYVIKHLDMDGFRKGHEKPCNFSLLGGL